VRISVIVPAFNEEQLLPESLARIRAAMQAFTDAGWPSELIVCDNNSTDRTAEIARAAGARVVFEPINQIARARNAGAAQASGDWLVFVDADSYPDVELFADVVGAIRQGRCIAGGSTVRVETRNVAARAIVAWWNATSRIARWAAGAFIFCETETFRRIGGFDEEWYAAEEIDLFRRLKREARRNRRRIVILHRHPLVTSARKARLYTLRETMRFYVGLFVTRGRALRTPEGTFLWYDGRRE
jgi:glycosyltransferase involved in cell wall biosynthesis